MESKSFTNLHVRDVNSEGSRILCTFSKVILIDAAAAVNSPNLILDQMCDTRYELSPVYQALH